MNKNNFTHIRSIIALTLFAGATAGAQEEVELPPGHPPVSVGTTSAATAEVALTIPHLLVEAGEDGTRALAVYVLTTLAATDETPLSPPREFIFGLPAGATAPTSVRILEGPHATTPASVRPVPEKNAWSLGLPPWEDEIKVRVESITPLTLDKAGFKQQFFYPVVELTLLVSPPDLVLAGGGLQFSGVIDAMGVSQWISPPIEPGGMLDFHVHAHAETSAAAASDIEALPNRTTMPKWALVLLFLMLLAFAVVISEMAKA